MARPYADDLRGSIENFIKGQFAPFEITSVAVYEDAERDGSPILDVVVFFNGTTYDLAMSEPPGFIVKLQEHLSKLGEDAFPLISFRLAELQAA